MKDMGNHTIFRIDWQEVLPVVLLPRAARFAFGFRSVFVTLLGVLLLAFASTVMFYSGSQARPTAEKFPVQPYLSKEPHIPYYSTPALMAPFMASFALPDGTASDWSGMTSKTVLSKIGTGPTERSPYYVPTNPFGSTTTSWRLFTMPGYNLFKKTDSSYDFLTRVGLFAIVLVVWSLIGGIITRGTAVRFATGGRESLKDLLTFISTKWLAYVGAILLPMVFITFLLLPAWLSLYLWSIHQGMIVAILSPVTILFTIFAFFASAGLILGWPLMFAAIGAESSDAFDAIGRGYSYVFQRPIQFLFYHAINQFIFWGATLVIGLFVYGVISFLQYHGMFPVTGDLTTSHDYPTLIALFWVWLLEMVVVVFPITYFWTSSTVIYFLLRRSCDAVPIDQVHRIGAALIKQSLPPIVKHEDGTPEMQS